MERAQRGNVPTIERHFVSSALAQIRTWTSTCEGFLLFADLLFVHSGMELPLTITATTDAAAALADASYIVHAVPVQYSRKYLQSVASLPFALVHPA